MDGESGAESPPSGKEKNRGSSGDIPVCARRVVNPLDRRPVGARLLRGKTNFAICPHTRGTDWGGVLFCAGSASDGVIGSCRRGVRSKFPELLRLLGGFRLIGGLNEARIGFRFNVRICRYSSLKGERSDCSTVVVCF